MPITLTQEYSRALAALEGAEFQKEVNARLATVIIGFQTIPSKPQGDAGLDGLSHNGTRGYCCYGLEHNGFKNNRAREQAVVNKFAGDLRRLFELEAKGRTLVHKATPELQTILAPRQQLRHVDLITNWFESHRVIGPLAAKLEEYKNASLCQYVRPDASAVVVGPADLANRYAVDEVTILRVRQRGFISRVHEVAQAISIDDPKSFDAKIEVLRQIRPDQLSAIESLADGFRVSWRMALAFERELDATAPNLHHSLEQARRHILIGVSELMLSAEQPWAELPKAEELSRSILKSDFGRLYGPLVPDVSSGEIARLIGECPVGWQRPEVKIGEPSAASDTR